MERPRVVRSDRIKLTEAFISNCAPRRILELGAGDYSFRHALGEKDVRWVTVDFAQPCDVLCDLNQPRVALPFRDATFDLAICTEVLEHLLWPQALLAETHRVLGPNGLIIVSVPNITSLTYRLAWLLGRIPSCAAGGNLPRELGYTSYKVGEAQYLGGHVIDFNKRRIVRLLEACGFQMVRVTGAGIFWHRQILPWWLVPTSLASVIICVARKAPLQAQAAREGRERLTVRTGAP